MIQSPAKPQADDRRSRDQQGAGHGSRIVEGLCRGEPGKGPGAEPGRDVTFLMLDPSDT